MSDEARIQEIKGLVDEASRGDAVAVDALLDRYLPGLRAFVRLRTGRIIAAKESSSDLVQSVCREILEHIDRFRFRGEQQFKHWLYATAVRKIAKRAEYYRADKRDAAKERPLELDAGSGCAEAYRSVFTPSEQLMGREEAARLERAFDRLPEDYREVILLSRVVGLSHAEIAQEMGRSELATRTLLSRALAQLSGFLED